MAQNWGLADGSYEHGNRSSRSTSGGISKLHERLLATQKGVLSDVKYL
jgi:hypothetical protein